MIKPSGMTASAIQPIAWFETVTGEVELGTAWRKTSERGSPYLSIVLDDPAFPARRDAALFTNAEERTARLVW